MQQWTPEQLQEQLDSGSTVFVKLWRNECAPCKAATPVVEKLSTEFPDIVFGEVSIDDYPEVAEAANVRAVPAFFVFVNKQLKGQHLGFRGADALKKFLEDSIKES